MRLIGRSEAIRTIEADIECAARSDAKVLITGETGVGKEVVARLIHKRSHRNGPMVAVNCAGLPDSLLESELFGHARGSFTGAYRDKPGLLEMAPHGTVFLDEVGEMSLRMQAVLLRFLETGEIHRVGSDRPVTRINLRLVTATNSNLQEQVSSGAFRTDLYYRLNVVRLNIPPLRERAEDVPLLIDHYLEVYAAQHKARRPEVSPAAMERLVAHNWPGNIRELRNIAERLVLKAAGRTIVEADFAADLAWSTQEPANHAAEPGASTSDTPAIVDELASRLLRDGESFWATVYPVFMSHDLTRDHLRKIVRLGLENARGDYRVLVQLFNMPDEDYKRFRGFLRKHHCHLPYQRFDAPNQSSEFDAAAGSS